MEAEDNDTAIPTVGDSELLASGIAQSLDDICNDFPEFKVKENNFVNSEERKEEEPELPLAEESNEPDEFAVEVSEKQQLATSMAGPSNQISDESPLDQLSIQQRQLTKSVYVPSKSRDNDLLTL